MSEEDCDYESNEMGKCEAIWFMTKFLLLVIVSLTILFFRALFSRVFKLKDLIE